MLYFFLFLIKGPGKLEEDIVAVDHPGLLVHGAAGERRSVQALVLSRQTKGIQAVMCNVDR